MHQYQSSYYRSSKTIRALHKSALPKNSLTLSLSRAPSLSQQSDWSHTHHLPETGQNDSKNKRERGLCGWVRFIRNTIWNTDTPFYPVIYYKRMNRRFCVHSNILPAFARQYRRSHNKSITVTNCHLASYSYTIPVKIFNLFETVVRYIKKKNIKSTNFSFRHFDALLTVSQTI